MSFSNYIGRVLGRWWLFTLLFTISMVIFSWIVPEAVAKVTAGRTLAPQILDEYIPTWTPDIARHFYEALGPDGRSAYREYYLHLDFWFPVLALTLCYSSLMSLAFRPGTKLAWLNLTPLLMYACDAAENINHFVMAGTYPDLPSFSLTYGPYFTATKWVLIMGLPIVPLLGFLKQWRGGIKLT